MRQGAASAVEALVSTGEVERVELDVHQGALPNAATPHARMEARSLALRTTHARGRAARSFARAPCNPPLPTRGRRGFPALDSTGTLHARRGRQEPSSTVIARA